MQWMHHRTSPAAHGTIIALRLEVRSMRRGHNARARQRHSPSRHAASSATSPQVKMAVVLFTQNESWPIHLPTSRSFQILAMQLRLVMRAVHSAARMNRAQAGAANGAASGYTATDYAQYSNYCAPRRAPHLQRPLHDSVPARLATPPDERAVCVPLPSRRLLAADCHVPVRPRPLRLRTAGS